MSDLAQSPQTFLSFNSTSFFNRSKTGEQFDRTKILLYKNLNEKFQCLVQDAIRRYKSVNNADTYDSSPAVPLLRSLFSLYPQLTPRISFYSDAAKVLAVYAGRELILDYDYDEPDSVFISWDKNGVLTVKDCKLTGLRQILELF
jgi:hypothetical protein